MRRFVGLVLMVGLLVSGCSGDPEPRFEEPPSSTPASDPSSATSTPAEDPEPWQEKSKAGAVAFAKHWVAVFNEAVVTGETAELKAMGAPRCVTCGDVVARIDRTYGSGGYFKSKGWRVLQTTVLYDPEALTANVGLRIRRSAEQYRDAAGEPVQSNPTSKATYRAAVEWVNGEWRMAQLVVFV